MIQLPLILDAGILLDMQSVNLLDCLLSVDRFFLTTNFVFNSIRKSINSDTFAKLAQNKNLEIFSIEQMDPFWEFYLSLQGSLSIEECSVLFSAQKMQAVLLLSDKNLIGFAKKNGVNSFGLLAVLKCMEKRNLLSPNEVATKWSVLMNKNKNLYKEECRKKIIQ